VGCTPGPAAQDRDLASAHHHLRTALELAEPHRYLATILEQGHGIGPLLLLSLPAVGTLQPCVHVGDGRGDLGRARMRRSVVAAWGDLSNRELDVTSRADAVRTGAARGLLSQGSGTRSSPC